MLHRSDEGGAPAGASDVPERGRSDRRPCVATQLLMLAAGLLITAPQSALAEVLGDPRDQPVVAFAINQALELERSGIAVPWANPETGRKGTIVLDPATYPQPDRPCRVYRRTIEQTGYSAAEIRGSGCRIGAALWTVDETIVTAAVAIARPDPPIAATPPPSPSPPAKVAPAKADKGKADKGEAASGKVAADPPPSGRKPSLPAYTLPSKAGS